VFSVRQAIVDKWPAAKVNVWKRDDGTFGVKVRFDE